MTHDPDYDRLVMLTRTTLAMLDVMHKILWELFDQELVFLACDQETDWDVLEHITCALVDILWPPSEQSEQSEF